MASKPTILSMHEAGIARLVFSQDYSSFEGVLVNFQDETFSVRGRNRHLASTSSDNDIQIDVQMEGEAGPAISYDVNVTEDETGNHFVLKRIELKVQEDTQICQLNSDSLNFKSDEVYVGTRADLEIKNYLTLSLAGKGHTVHMGSMSINFQASLTPPPTPLRNEDSNDMPMETSEDYLQ